MSDDKLQQVCQTTSCAAVAKTRATLVGKRSVNSSLFSGLIIAVLPKCPLCAMAYSTAVTMCSGTMYDHEANWTSYLSIALALITLGLVLFNRKGRKTVYAALFIVIGGAILAYAELVTGNVNAYYIGCGLVLLGVWTNGSLYHFARRGRAFMKNKVVQNA